MAGDNNQNSGDSDTDSLERFRRRQRRKLLSTQVNSSRSGGSGTAYGTLPIDHYLPNYQSSSPGSDARKATLTTEGNHVAGIPCQATVYTESRSQRVTTAIAPSIGLLDTTAKGLEHTKTPTYPPRHVPEPPSGPAGALSPPRPSQRAAEKPAQPRTSPTHRAGAAAAPARVVEGPTGAGPSSRPAQAEFRNLQLRIETEFLIAAQNPDHVRPSLELFAKFLAVKHNLQVGRARARMMNTLLGPTDWDDYRKWSMVHGSTKREDKSPWGMKLRSPVLDVYPLSLWRTHIMETWAYLNKHYRILGDDNCSTHINVSLMPNYNLADLKLIASAIIHFEEAFEALMPDHRRGNEFATSNWLGSPYLSRQGKNRRQSIEAIQAAHNEVDLFRLIQGYNTNDFCWNFLPVFGSNRSIEFRQPPGSLKSIEVLGWAELVMHFVQASVRFGSSLQLFPANVGGLRSFIEQIHHENMNNADWLLRLWAGKPNDMAFPPKEIHPEILSKRDTTQRLTGAAMAALRLSRSLYS